MRRGSRSRNHRIGTAGTGAVEPGRPRRVLELTSGDVVYFDPALGRKLIGKSPRRVLRHGQGQSQDRHVPDDRPRRAVVAGRCRPGIRLRGPQGRAGVQDALHGSLHGRNVRRLGDRTYALVFRPAGRLRRCGVPDIRRAGVWNANCTARGMEKRIGERIAQCRHMDWAVLYMRLFAGGMMFFHNIGKIQDYNEIVNSYPSFSHSPAARPYSSSFRWSKWCSPP